MNGKLKLFVVGSGPEEEHLKALAYKMGLDSKIIFLGTKDGFDELFLGADVFLHTSKHEGHGIVVIQALLSGLPVLSSSQGFVTELSARTLRVVELNSKIDEWIKSLVQLYRGGRATDDEISRLIMEYDSRFQPKNLEQALLQVLNESMNNVN